MKLPLYDLEPRNENCWIAPNATISTLLPYSLTFLVGEVLIKQYSSIWSNCVIRGDINRIEYIFYFFLTHNSIMNFTSIGDGTVIHTAASLPTGMSARCYIGYNVTVGSHCTLYSCHIDDDVVIGDRCVILEGARLEKGC